MDLSRSYAESGSSIEVEDRSSDARRSAALQAMQRQPSVYRCLQDN